MNYFAKGLARRLLLQQTVDAFGFARLLLLMRKKRRERRKQTEIDKDAFVIGGANTDTRKRFVKTRTVSGTRARRRRRTFLLIKWTQLHSSGLVFDQLKKIRRRAVSAKSVIMVYG